MTPTFFLGEFIVLDLGTALQVVLLGFIGGVLSGFIGSGGAFFMTPGMMNLGVPGVIAVGTNITHKFGKALMGSRKHGELGNVDKKLGLYLQIGRAVGLARSSCRNPLTRRKKGPPLTTRQRFSGHRTKAT